MIKFYLFFSFFFILTLILILTYMDKNKCEKEIKKKEEKKKENRKKIENENEMRKKEENKMKEEKQEEINKLFRETVLLSKRQLRHLYQSLHNIDNIFSYLGISLYWLCGGSLIALLRSSDNNLTTHLPWDDDLDIEIEKNEFMNKLATEKGMSLLQEYGMELDFSWNSPATQHAKIRIPHAADEPILMVDLFLVEDDGNGFLVNHRCSKMHIWDKKNLFPLKKYKYGPIYFNGPNNILGIFQQKEQKFSLDDIKNIVIYPKHDNQLRSISEWLIKNQNIPDFNEIYKEYINISQNIEIQPLYILEQEINFLKEMTNNYFFSQQTSANENKFEKIIRIIYCDQTIIPKTEENIVKICSEDIFSHLQILQQKYKRPIKFSELMLSFVGNGNDYLIENNELDIIQNPEILINKYNEYLPLEYKEKENLNVDEKWKIFLFCYYLKSLKLQFLFLKDIWFMKSMMKDPINHIS